MSLLKIEVREEHFKLLKNLRWSLTPNENKFIISLDDENESEYPFGGDTPYEGMDIILNGKPENFDPFNTEGPKEFTPDQIKEFDKLYSELPLVLEVILYTQQFKEGLYQCNYNLHDWKLL